LPDGQPVVDVDVVRLRVEFHELNQRRQQEPQLVGLQQFVVRVPINSIRRGSALRSRMPFADSRPMRSSWFQ